jgi:hypothetical protein
MIIFKFLNYFMSSASVTLLNTLTQTHSHLLEPHHPLFLTLPADRFSKLQK